MPVYLPAGHLRRNTLVLGNAGSGKSTYLQHVARGVLDDAAWASSCSIPTVPRRRASWAWCPPRGRRRPSVSRWPTRPDPIGLNLLDVYGGRTPSQIEEGLITGFKYHWDGSWGARMENVFRYALRTLLEANLSRAAGGAIYAAGH